MNASTRPTGLSAPIVPAPEPPANTALRWCDVILRRAKTEFSMSALHHGLLPFGGNQRSLVDAFQGLQDQPRIGTASRDPAAVSLALPAEAHQPDRRQGLKRPLRRQLQPRVLEPSAQPAWDQQRQRRHEDVGLDPRLDLVRARPQRQHVLELPEPTLDSINSLDCATASRMLRSFSLVEITYFPSIFFSRPSRVSLSEDANTPPISFQSK